MSIPPKSGSVTPASGALLDGVAQELHKRIRKEQFDTWFRGFEIVSADDSEVVFSVPNGFVRDWITRNYLDDLTDAVASVTGSRPRVRVSFALNPGAMPLDMAEPDPPQQPKRNGNGDASATTDPSADAPDAQGADPSRPAVANGSLRSDVQEVLSSAIPDELAAEPTQADAAPRVATDQGASLNSNYTFEEFVVGPCNRLAHAAALAIGANPGRAYNPFFVHGNVGLGKTHLLQAICHAVLRRQPNAKVIYVSCEEFTNRFIDSIQNRTLREFRDYHRSADVLVIDDVEFLAHKSQTQEEFFHTFNALYNRQAQIVLSSDRRAPEIPTLEERLVSRFKWGLETDMTQPCFETRAAIVRRKARMRGVDMPPDVVHCLAETVTSNIRELEGAVTKVLGLASITGKPVDLALAEQALREGSVMRSRLVSMPNIMDLITSEFSISAKDLLGKSRTQAISLPRQIGMFLARHHTEHSLEEVGRFFGNRDHTTVLYAVGKIRKRSQQDRMFQELLNGLSQRLQSGA